MKNYLLPLDKILPSKERQNLFIVFIVIISSFTPTGAQDLSDQRWCESFDNAFTNRALQDTLQSVFGNDFIWYLDSSIHVSDCLYSQNEFGNQILFFRGGTVNAKSCLVGFKLWSMYSEHDTYVYRFYNEELQVDFLFLQYIMKGEMSVFTIVDNRKVEGESDD